jgi:N-acetylmuramoyl-L-alanine amidase
MAKHTVKQGECIESIAFEKGFFWETIWNDSQNAELKRNRKDPNVLFMGDEVFIPEKNEKTESCATKQRHRFRKKGVPSKFRLVLEDEQNQPRANLPYVLKIDGELFSGETDAEGALELQIPPNAKLGKLTVEADDDKEVYELNFGHIDPISEVSGIQARLNNLGYDCGPTDGKLCPATKEAISTFQEEHGLPVTGEPDEQTQQKLKEEHAS